jgi:hypothetical protein
MRPTTESGSRSKGSARKPAKIVALSKKTLPESSRIVDTTAEALESGITGYAIIGGVPPESWLREHGYVVDDSKTVGLRGGVMNAQRDPITTIRSRPDNRRNSCVVWSSLAGSAKITMLSCTGTQRSSTFLTC